MTNGFALYRARNIAATTAAAVTLVAGGVGGAQANTYVNAGSRAPQDVTRVLTSEYVSSGDPAGHTWITVGAAKPAGSVSTGKAACNTNYGTGKSPWPDYDDHAIAALINERSGARANCLSFVRSSRGPQAGTIETSLTYAKVANDAVTWATKKPGVPNNLTQQQVKDIYNCTITDWSQIPGSTASGWIQKIMPPYGSDTYRDFVQKVLGGVHPTLPPGTCASTVTATIEEDRGDAAQITSANAIVPYSVAVYRQQANSAVTGVANHTNGFVLGNIDGKAPNAYNFAGNRDIFYVYDTVDTENDADTVAFINWVRAPAQQPIWTVFGFGPW